MKGLVVVGLIAAGVATAGADPDKRWRTETAIGVRVGRFDVGRDLVGAGHGYHVGGGARRDRWVVLGEYENLSIVHHDPTAAVEDRPHARVHRLGLMVRYSLGRLVGRGRPRFRHDLWVEAGAGEQWIRRTGEASRRPDLSVGLGAQFSVRFGPRPGNRVGLYYAIRATFAQRPDTGEMRAPVCAGPCDHATRPLAIDHGVLLNLGVLFGN